MSCLASSKNSFFRGSAFTSLSAIVGVLVASHSAHAQVTSINVSSWTTENYPVATGYPNGSWTVNGGGASVTQTVNGQPTLFVGDFSIMNKTIKGNIVVNETDDDFIGLALGFRANDTTNAAANYLLVDWKAGTQTVDFAPPAEAPAATANAGFAVSRVSGIPIANEFWGHNNYTGTGDTGGSVTELARGTTLGNSAWTRGTNYSFQVDYTPNRVRVLVNNVVQADLTGSFADGNLAFYNFSQSGVTYSALTQQPSVLVVPESGTLGLIVPVLGLVGAMVIRSRKK